MEIERKYLLETLPDKKETDIIHLEQGYISTSPVIRIRSTKSTAIGTERYILTVKGAGMIAREEFELDLDKTQFETLKKKCSGSVIIKDRHLYTLPNGHTAEVDVFDGANKGLILAEVEFGSEEDMNAFVPPEWFGKDVSDDYHYHNSYLSQKRGEDE